MFLLNPAALGFAVLVPLIIALYLLKLRRQPARVSTLMFWQRVAADTRRRALFQRLRQVLSLLLQLLIFALLLFALARPETRSFHGALTGQSTVVILDARARTQALLPDGTTRFAAMRAIASSYLRRASPRSPVALLAADAAPRVVVGLTDEEKPLLAGLDTLHATDAGSRLEDAVSLAGELLAGRTGGKRIVLVTDHPVPLPSNIPPVEVETRLVGTDASPRENVGLTRLSARPLPSSPDTAEVFVELENFGSQHRTGHVELSYEGQLVDVKPFDLAPGERRAEVYPALVTRTGLANARGWLTAHLVCTDGLPDALPLDDDACAVIPPTRPARVLLVTRGDWFLESVLKADNQLTFDQLTPDTFQPAQAASFDVTILDDVLPDGFGQTPDGIPQGSFLFLRRAPLPRNGDAELARPPLTDLDADSPLLRLVNLRDVTVLRAQDWNVPPAPAGEPADGWRLSAPVRSLEHPLVVMGEKGAPGRGGQRFVAWAFGAGDSDLPLRVAFPLFMRNAVNWLAGRDGVPGNPEAGTRAGEVITLSEGETVWTHAQHGYQPVSAIPPAESVAGPGVFQPMQAGFYLRRGADGTDHWLAVNTGDREMSMVNAAPAIATPGRLPLGSAAPVGEWRVVGAWPPWVYLAFFAFILCTLEWWSFHHRRTE